jgi:hypothetical protein
MSETSQSVWDVVSFGVGGLGMVVALIVAMTGVWSEDN